MVDTPHYYVPQIDPGTRMVMFHTRSISANGNENLPTKKKQTSNRARQKPTAADGIQLP